MTSELRAGCRSRWLLTVALVTAVGLVIVPSADAHVYWTRLGTFFEGGIGRASLDGTRIERRFVRRAIGPGGLAVDARRLYWANTDGGTIGRSRLDGSKVDQSFIAEPGEFPFAVAARAGRIYWTLWGPIGGNAAIGRANADGSAVEPGFATLSSQYDTPTEIDVDGEYVYWANAYPAYTIGRATLDGSIVDPSFIAGLDNPYGLAITDTHIYWSNRGSRTIARARLDGTEVDVDLIKRVRTASLAIQGRRIYWPQGRGIARASLDGTNVKREFIRLGYTPEAVAADRRGR